MGGEKFVGHCHSVMHEFAAHAHTETIQIFKFSGGETPGPPDSFKDVLNITPSMLEVLC